MIWARILLVALAQTVALAYMIVDRQAMLNASRLVTLKVTPVDPMDPLRGEFVILSYDISRLNTAELNGDDQFNYGDTVYVTLEKRGEDWAATAVAHRPIATPNSIAIKGKISRTDQPANAATTLWVDYGIESYFVPQGMGREIENERQSGNLTADIAIDQTGRAAIKAMRRKGQVFYVEGIL